MKLERFAVMGFLGCVLLLNAWLLGRVQALDTPIYSIDLDRASKRFVKEHPEYEAYEAPIFVRAMETRASQLAAVEGGVVFVAPAIVGGEGKVVDVTDIVFEHALGAMKASDSLEDKDVQ